MRPGPCAAVVAGLLAASGMLAGCSAGPPGPPPPPQGNAVYEPLPADVSSAAMVDQTGRRVDLASWRGRAVVVVPFLTLCQEVCPLTTADLAQVESSIRTAGDAARVEIVEVSVDPGRDSPSRLAAYARLTGASWELVSPTGPSLAVLEKFFGWYAQKVPEPKPPGIDWWTHTPLTYDVAHSDGYAVLDPSGKERFETGASPAFDGKLAPALSEMLSAQGRNGLRHPQPQSWTPRSMLATLGWVLRKDL